MAFNVLILCTGNSARSVMAEALLGRKGGSRFKAYSAGSKPAGAVNPVGAALLEEKGYDIGAYSSKSWDVFSGPDAPKMDAVITVCGNAAEETCPLWPGAPVQVHWGFSDPAAIEGPYAEKYAAFQEIYSAIEPYMEALVALPVEKMAPTELQHALQAIAKKYQ
ncbi:MAG: arsenate reductase ArsC [Kordiimonadaceae bacterium]|nr:arsenate reductase ArsC [Kordiimonadaceae bacterium]